MRILPLKSLILCLMLLCGLSSQAHALQTPLVSLKWTSYSGTHIPLLSVTLGNATKLFVLDTGSPATMLDRSTALSLQLKVDTYKFTNPDQTVEYVRTPLVLKPGLFELDNVPFVLADLSAVRQADPNIVGILGLNVLQNFSLRLDYAHQQLELFDRKMPFDPSMLKDAVRVPMIHANDKYSVDATIDGKQTRFAVDTGAEYTFLRAPEILKALKPKAKLEGYQVAMMTHSGTDTQTKQAKLLRLQRLDLNGIIGRTPLWSNK